MRRFLLVLLAACDAASSDPGLESLLQVEGAQYREGPFPVDEGGPGTLAISAESTQVAIGSVNARVRGVLEPTARVAVLGIDGVDGAWLVPAGVADIDTPGQPTARAVFGVAEDFPPGPFMLRIAAADERGRFGAAATTMLVADEVPPPAGELVIALRWEGAADLDLHVVAPDGGEAWSQNPNTMKPPVPGEPVDPDEYLKHGRLDHDGNQDCRRDGNPNEHVIWTQPPQTGEYVVRVDARSMCGAPIAYWYVAVYRNGVLLDETSARGTSTAADVVRLPLPPAQWHGTGAGTFALRFSL